MAKIGSPLQITERKSVQEPMMLPSTSQVGNQVQALKIDYMPYEIGQANAEADSMLSGELTKMAATFAEAYKANEDINKQYKLNLLEKDMGDNDRLYKEKWAKTRNYEEKSVVVADYRNSITDFGKRFNQIYPEATPKEQRVGMGLVSKSLGFATTYEAQASVAQFNETFAQLKLQQKENLKDLKTKANIDAQFELDKGIGIMEKMLGIRGITPEQFRVMKNEYIQEATLGRATLLANRFGEDWAKNDSSEYPNHDQVLEVIHAQLGLDATFTKDQTSDLYNAWDKSYTAKLIEENKEWTAQEATAERNYTTTITSIQNHAHALQEDGHWSYQSASAMANEYTRLGLKGRASAIIKQYKAWDTSPAVASVVDEWTNPEGEKMSQLVQSSAENPDDPMALTLANGTVDPVRLRILLEATNMHKPTKRAIVAFYRKRTGRNEKEYSEGAVLTANLNVVLNNMHNASKKEMVTVDGETFERPASEAFTMMLIGKPLSLKSQVFLDARKEGQDFVTMLSLQDPDMGQLINAVKQDVMRDFASQSGFFERAKKNINGKMTLLKDRLWLGGKEDQYVLNTDDANRNFREYLTGLFLSHSEKKTGKREQSRKAIEEQVRLHKENTDKAKQSAGAK